MIRFFDISLSILAITIFIIPMAIIYTLIYLNGRHPLFFQTRLGLRKKPFQLIKFRSMHVGTDSLPTHEVDRNSITKLGSFIRKSKLDELPQLWNVLVGDMSFVGPRPCLPTQEKLIIHRDMLNIFEYKPGISGVAQLNGIDMSNPEKLAKEDKKMMKNFSLRTYLTIIAYTAMGKGFGDRVGNS